MLISLIGYICVYFVSVACVHQYAIYWPTKKDPKCQYGPFEVELTETNFSENPNVTFRDFKLTKASKVSRHIGINATLDSWFAQDTAYLDVKHKMGDNIVRYKCCHESHCAARNNQCQMTVLEQ